MFPGLVTKLPGGTAPPTYSNDLIDWSDPSELLFALAKSSLSLSLFFSQFKFGHLLFAMANILNDKDRKPAMSNPHVASSSEALTFKPKGSRFYSCLRFSENKGPNLAGGAHI